MTARPPAYLPGWRPSLLLLQPIKQVLVAAVCVPTLAQQMDSLVRIGASMQSPDPYAAAAVAAEMLLQHQQAAAGQWDSSANPLLSHTGSEKYLRELQVEMQRHGPPGPGHASRPGSSRTSLEGGHEAHAAGEQALAPDAAAGGGARKLAAPLPLHQLYAEGSKYPGAGTWVRCVPACA